MESAVATDEPCLFSFGLCNEQTVKWIVMVERQFIQYIDMAQAHRQNSQIIGGFLSPDHLLKRDVQSETVDLPFDLDFPGADNAQIQLVGSSHASRAL